MPSLSHEALLLLFRNRPALAAELLEEVLGLELPPYAESRVDSAELPDVQPAEYRADLVVLVGGDTLAAAIIVEVQLSPDSDKRFAWPSYVANLRARLRLPVSLLVVTITEEVARWAARPIELGGGNVFRPLVLRLADVPEITDEARAHSDPELAVLSAVAHGEDSDVGKVARIAATACEAAVSLDGERSTLYFDLVLASLGEAARRELQTMDPAKYEYQSEFARRYVAQGRVEGELEGRVDLLVRLLTQRFGTVSDETLARIRSASIDELDAIGERLLAAESVEEVLGGH